MFVQNTAVNRLRIRAHNTRLTGATLSAVSSRKLGKEIAMLYCGSCGKKLALSASVINLVGEVFTEKAQFSCPNPLCSSASVIQVREWKSKFAAVKKFLNTPIFGRT